MNRFQIDAVVDDVELRLRGAEMRANFAPDHARIADDGAQPRAFEQAAFRSERVAVIGIEREAEPAESSERRAAVVQPLGVHPVARAVNVAARDALVRLHEVKRPAGDFAAYRPREAPVAPYAADVKRIAANHRARITGPLTRQHGHRDALLAERAARSFDESLRAPVSAVALPHQGDVHCLVPRELEPLAQGANAPEHVGPLREEPIRVDRVNSLVSNGGNRFKTLPRLERLAPEAARDDRIGPGVEDLLSGDERREGLRGGKNVVPAAEAQRVADQVRAVHGEQGGVPDLQKHRDATLRGVALAQIRDFAFELPRARVGELRASGQRPDQANDARNIVEAARLGDEDLDADALQTIDLQRRIAAAPGEHEIRPQGDQALDIDPAVARHD